MDDDPAGDRLCPALDNDIRILGLGVAEWETILAALDDPSAQASCSRPKRWSTNTWRKRTPRASNIVGGMGTFIELRLTTGEKRHVETGESNAQTEIDRWARREKTSWIETVEGIWVNPEHILEVRLVELPGPPRPSE